MNIKLRDIQVAINLLSSNCIEILHLVPEEPGRPPKAVAAGTVKAPKTGRKKPATSSELTIQYSQQGLSSANMTVLRQLAKDKGVEAVSTKDKPTLIKLLLEKPHVNTVTVIHQTTRAALRKVLPFNRRERWR